MSSVYKRPFANAKATFFGGISAGVRNDPLAEADRLRSSCVAGEGGQFALEKTQFIHRGGKE